MKLDCIDINLYRTRFTRFSASLVFSIYTAVVIIYLLSGTAIAFQPRKISSTLLSLSSQTALLPTVVASPTASNSTNLNGASASSQDSQAQNDLSIANTVITLVGIVIALAGLVLTFLTIGGAIAGFFGVREFRRIRRIRKTVALLEQEVKGQQKQLAQTTKDLESNKELLAQFTNESQALENRLKRLDQEVRDKSLLEASYYFNEGTKAYREGDNEHAVDNYEQALLLQQDSPRILERLGRAYSNLNNMEKAVECLNKALQIDPENVPALRSLALCYRYTNKEQAIKYFERSLEINPSDYETWDFLGLLYRDQKLIEKAIFAHEKALTLEIKKRPETEFYLSILLLYSPEGDKIRARNLMSAASNGILEKEHDQRIRPVWKIIIQAGLPIIDGKKEEAFELVQSLTQYITTQRIYEALKGHLQFLLEGTDHREWKAEFMNILKLKAT